MLIGALVIGVSGVLPAAAAGGDCCVDSCADGDEAKGASDTCGERDEAGENEGTGDGTGCPPLCGSCVCAAYFAPALVGAVADLWVAPAIADDASQVIVHPSSPPPTGVFHPPRAA